MKFLRLGLPMAASLLLSPILVADDHLNQCLLRHIATADDDVTLGQLKQRCQAGDALSGEVNKQAEHTSLQLVDHDAQLNADSAISRRLALEEAQRNNPFVLLPHKPNYIILSNNLASPNERPFELADPDDNVHFQPWETKFQISLKLPVMTGLFNDRADLFMAYTNRSFWQQFNKAGSAPFRESDHEPEVWLSFANDLEFFGIKNPIIRTGFSHQSNGQSGRLSRSWNRVYADFILEYRDWYFSLKPWWRVPQLAENDDNPDIEDYMGNFELGGLYQAGEHNFNVMLRNNLNTGENYGAIELGWSFPLTKRVRGYVQWFNGYGESLIDYDAHSNSIGFGVQLSDWL